MLANSSADAVEGEDRRVGLNRRPIDVVVRTRDLVELSQ